MRSRFQGTKNIVLFNWHFYIIALLMGLTGILIASWFPAPARWLIYLGIAAATLMLFVSLVASYFIYDRSNLYSLPWLDSQQNKLQTIVNIHAGFDETSTTLEQTHPQADAHIWDFFDPNKHTEVSIKRARSAYPPLPSTIAIHTDELPMQDGKADLIVVFMAAHEIRNPTERSAFFQELNRIAATNGRIYVTEHLRDLPNFLVYTIGFIHFYPKKTWLRVFEESNLKVVKEYKTTPFISTFCLERIA